MIIPEVSLKTKLLVHFPTYLHNPFSYSTEDTMTSSQSSKSWSGEWRNQIYFDPQADSSTDEGYYIDETDLQTELLKILDAKEAIEEIWVHSHRLFGWQLYEGIFLYHAFVILKTNKWYWSVEKNTAGITIQRSKELSFVKYKYRRSSRIQPITERTHDSGILRMEDLVMWLFATNELSKGYCVHFQASNCQGFSKRIFNFFAKTKVCRPFVL